MKVHRGLAPTLASLTLAFGAVACGPSQPEPRAPEAAPSASQDFDSGGFDRPAQQRAEPVVMDGAAFNRAFRNDVIDFLQSTPDFDKFECLKILSPYDDGSRILPEENCLGEATHNVRMQGSRVLSYKMNGDSTDRLLNNMTGYTDEHSIRLFTAAHELGHHLDRISGKRYSADQTEVSAILYSYAVLYTANPQAALDTQKNNYIPDLGESYNDFLRNVDIARLTANGTSIEALYNETSRVMAEWLDRPAPAPYHASRAPSSETQTRFTAADAARPAEYAPAPTPASSPPPQTVERPGTQQEGGGRSIALAAPRRIIIETPR